MIKPFKVSYEDLLGQRHELKYPYIHDCTFWHKNNNPDYVSYKYLVKNKLYLKYFLFQEGFNGFKDIFSGIDFITYSIKGKIYPSTIPQIADLIVRKASRNTEIFLFLELLNHKYPLDKVTITTQHQFVKLIQDLLTSLNYIHASGFWHSDFKDGNILISNGKFYLIDIDSVRNLKVEYPIGNFTSNTLETIAILLFANKGSRIMDAINGAELNLIQLLMLVYIYQFRARKRLYNLRAAEIIHLSEFIDFIHNDADLNNFTIEFLLVKSVISFTDRYSQILLLVKKTLSALINTKF